MSVRDSADTAGELRSIVRDRANDIILSRVQVGLGILLFADILFAVADLRFGSPNLLAECAVRLGLAVAFIVLLMVTRAPWAPARAVALALLVVALGCVQAVGGSLRGDVTAPAVMTIVLATGVSMALPWGVWAQLAAITMASVTTLAMISVAIGRVDLALLAYPVTAVGIAFGASIYVAYLSRRNLIASIEQEIARTQADSALRASEEQTRRHLLQLDTLYRTAPIGLGLVDTNLRFLRINETLADMNGVPAADHGGRTVREILPDLADTIEPLVRSVIATGQPLLDLEVGGSTAREPGATRHWRVGYLPVRDPHGTVVAVSCAVQEVTEQRRTQEALRQNEERLRIVSQATNDAVWDWNLVTQAVWWNEGVRTLFGYSAADVGPTATWWYDHIHPLEREQIVAGIHALIDSGQQYWSAEYRYQRADGSYACVFDRGYVFHDDNGKPVRMIGAMIDISKRKHAEDELARLNADLECRVGERTAQLQAANRRLEHEIAERQQAAEALRESQKQLQDILDNTTAVIYLKDSDGRYLLINRQYEVLFHVSREQVRGKTDYDFFPRDAADLFRANDRQVLAANCALNFEEVAPHDDGLHTYISLKFPLRDSSGRPYGSCGISTDITARKQMEAELRTSQAELSALIENTTDAIFSIDRDYRLTACNTVMRQLFQGAYGKSLRLGDPFESRAPAREREHWRPLYERVLAGERIVFERDYALAGEVGSYLISMTPIVADGQVTGATVFTKDITDLKRAEEHARRRQAELTHVLRVSTVGEMAAGLAHEINQPLAAIANYAQGCRRRLSSGSARPNDLLPVIEEIAGQALRAGEIIRRLRHLVQKGETPREQIDLNAIVTDAAHVIEPQAHQQGVTLRIDLASGLPPIEVDQIQIEQVILNLMLNGLEAMQTTNGTGPELSVCTALSPDGTVEVAVRDTGVGLTPLITDRMFEPFFTSKSSGLGMGLAISRSIVDGHGGRLWATNNADGGATFRVALPLGHRHENPTG